MFARMGWALAHPVQFVRLQKWKYAHGLFFFQWKPQHVEFETFFVEGKKGEGKTRYLAGWACDQMRRDIRICANFTITDRYTGRSAVLVDGWMEILRKSVEALREGIPTVFVIDEFHLWADSRSWSKMPSWFRGWMAQSRHYGVGFCGSVQNFKNIDLRARQLADELRRVRKVHFFGIPIYRMEEVEPETVDAEGEYGLSDAHLGLFKWYAGYDTRELIQVEDWFEDEELDAEIKQLTAEAASLVSPAEFSSFLSAAGPACGAVGARTVSAGEGGDL